MSRAETTAPQRYPRAVRVGVLNLMPRAETYEPLLSEALGPEVELAWLRLATHAYRSSDAAQLAARYRTFEAALDGPPLDALLLTGAPVETLAFDEVRYWPELRAVLREARARALPALGLCWGAMALAATLGVRKIPLPHKLFGAFEHALTPAGSRLLPALEGRYRCAQSRHAGLHEGDLRRAEERGALRRLAWSDACGTTLLASADGLLTMHLGHPEYVPSRIAFEWSRDRAAGRDDVRAPHAFDADGGATTLPWARDARAFFDAWIDGVTRRARGQVAA